MAKAEYRSAIRSRKLIKAALADLLQEKPLEKITVTDVVNRAEINRGTFYAHYADIPDVINHLIQNAFSQIREVLNKESYTNEELPHVLLQQLENILSEDMDFYMKVLNSSAAALMQDQLVEIVVDYMLQNQVAFFSGTKDQYELIIRFGAGGLSNLYRDWFSGKIPCTLSELTRSGEQIINRIIGNA